MRIWIILLLSVGLSVMTSTQLGIGSGDDDEPYRQSKRTGSQNPKGEYYKARLRVADHVLDADTLLLDVQVSPTEHNTSFPGVKVNLDDGYTHSVTVVAKIVIRGISTPVGDPSRTRSLDEIDREIRRFDETMHYLRRILLASPYLIVGNPEKGLYNDVVADVYIVTGGQRMDVASMMLNDGYALPNDRRWNWGWRVPIEE